MPGTLDRIKASILALVGSSLPRVDYLGVYRGRVVSQSGDVVDVMMDDPRIPNMSQVPIQIGLPGATVSFAAGARMLIGFENGDPAKPIALLWDAGTATTVARLSLPALLLELGARGAQEPVIRGLSRNAADKALMAAVLTYASAIQSIADPSTLATSALTAAISAYTLAIDAALSVTVKTV